MIFSEEVNTFLKENHERIEGPIRFILKLERGIEFDDDNQRVSKGFKVVKGKVEIITARAGNALNNSEHIIVPLEMGVVIEEYGCIDKVHVFGLNGWEVVETEINY